MARQPFFVCICANCRKRLEVEISKLGRELECSHCQKMFVAIDPHIQSAAIDDPLNYWIRFTDHVYNKTEFEMLPGKDIERTPR